MILVVNNKTNRIEMRYEAWEEGSYNQAYKDIKAKGFKPTKEEVALSGNMVIWVD